MIIYFIEYNNYLMVVSISNIGTDMKIQYLANVCWILKEI